MTEEVKKRRLATKYRKTNDNSLQARRDYARHDGGPDVREVHQDIPGDYLQRMAMGYYHAHICLSGAKTLELESATRDQGMGDDIGANLWMAERRKRVTASSCGQIAKCRTMTKVAILVKTLLYSSFRGNTATQWGHIQEPLTKEAYLLEKRRISPDIVVIDSGFVVHRHHRWLGASPNGLVDDPISADPEGIMEYKNPYSIRLLALEDAASQGIDFLPSPKGCIPPIDTTHMYFYQVQATMFCTAGKWCDFVVRTTVDLHVERIVFDPDFWRPALLRSRRFYFSAILPELANPRPQKGGIREPSDWLHEPEGWNRKTETL